MPNDLINALEILKVVQSNEARPIHTFRLSIGCVDGSGSCTEVFVEIDARDLYLQGPDETGPEIRE